MRLEDVEFIRKYTQVLVGAQWISAGRAAAMAWFVFRLQDTEYYLHVQSAVRIRTMAEVLNANLDMFDPLPEVEESTTFDWDSYDWDVQGANCWDKWCQRFGDRVANGSEEVVRKVDINDAGDMVLQMESGLIIDVFVNSSNEECWRLFERESEYHLVVTGAGLGGHESRSQY